jgi:hypothetical protein
MKKFNMVELKHMSTLMSTTSSLGPDEDDGAVDQREYMSMIGSLLYLTVTRSDIYFAVGLPHALHIGRQFSESSGISNTPLSLGFGILLLLHLILLAFLMLILRVLGLTERALLGLVIFLNLLSFVGLLKNNL